MSDRCLKPEELADLTVDDPRRSHLQNCFTCQAVLKSFAGFMDPAAIPEEADLADARVRLSSALDREIGLGEVVRPTSSFWTPFRVRSLAAVAAVVIVAVGLSVVRPGSEDLVLRGAGEVAVALKCEIVALPTNGYRVSWSAVEEAHAYQVVVYGAGLEELMNYDAGAGVTIDIQPPEGSAFCRVIALHEGDEVARSEPGYFLEQ